MWRVSLVSVIGVAAMAASAAWGQASGGGAPAGSQAGNHLLKLLNSGRQQINAIYYAPPGNTDWSDDLLGKQTAGPGRTVSLRIKDPKGACVFDLIFLMSNGDTVTKGAINVCAEPSYTFTP